MSWARVDGYDFFECLGKGLQGTVFRVQSVATRENFAAKVIKTQYLSVRARARLQKEVLTMTRLRPHPHLLTIVHSNDSVSMPSCPYASLGTEPVFVIVMAYAKHGEIYEFIEQGAFSEKFVRHFFKSLIAALQYAKHESVAHRDIKAENVLVDGSYQVRLVDWGLAAISQDYDHAMLKTYVGTEGYMAPEVRAGALYLPEPADVWSMGCLLFILSHGFPPFSAAEVGDWWFDRVREGDYANFWDAHKRSATVSPLLEDLLEKILVAEPSGRLTYPEILAHPWVTAVVPPETFGPSHFAAEMRSRIAAIAASKQPPRAVEASDAQGAPYALSALRVPTLIEFLASQGVALGTSGEGGAGESVGGGGGPSNASTSSAPSSQPAPVSSPSAMSPLPSSPAPLRSNSSAADSTMEDKIVPLKEREARTAVAASTAGPSTTLSLVQDVSMARAASGAVDEDDDDEDEASEATAITATRGGGSGGAHKLAMKKLVKLSISPSHNSSASASASSSSSSSSSSVEAASKSASSKLSAPPSAPPKMWLRRRDA